MITPFFSEMYSLIKEIKNCRICEAHLPLGPRPVVQASTMARILIVGQAPGIRVHETGIPFNDPSGDRLRSWMGINRDIFYDEARIALVPMGFCYPGSADRGDLPPRKECADKWREALLSHMKKIELTIVIGQYAIEWHLGKERKKTLRETVKAWRDYAPQKMVLPHPSPRNNIWLKKNPWFEQDILPVLRRRVGQLI